MRQTGVLKKVKTDIINCIKSDTSLTNEGYYYSWLEVKETTKKPCHSVDLDEETIENEGCFGGDVDSYSHTGYIITYIDPNIKKGLTDDLDIYKEKIRNCLTTSNRLDSFTVIKSLDYTRSYSRPWAARNERTGKTHIIAHRIITEFNVTYNVLEASS